MSMSKLAEVIVEKTGCSKRRADIAIREVFGVISDEVANGPFVIRGFGSFRLKHSKPRTFSTRDGQVDVPARERLGFRCSNRQRTDI